MFQVSFVIKSNPLSECFYWALQQMQPLNLWIKWSAGALVNFAWTQILFLGQNKSNQQSYWHSCSSSRYMSQKPIIKTKIPTKWVIFYMRAEIKARSKILDLRCTQQESSLCQDLLAQLVLCLSLALSVKFEQKQTLHWKNVEIE